ncbi:MAG TPA: SRPBCC family protein [Trinickia sp.]|nr:SRPBCC family protein [Trinickia sp.]
MTKPAFVYVTYIATTPEKAFNALIDPEMTKQYWVNHRNASDWKVGSQWEHRDYDDASTVDIVGTVVESDPPRKLVVTWAFPSGGGESRVTYLIEPAYDLVRLTVTHDELESGSEMEKGITSGWPIVLSSLKSLLETGRALPFTTTRDGWRHA